MSLKSEKVESVLLLQKPALLQEHAEIVHRCFKAAGKQIEVSCAASASDIPKGLVVDAIICPTLPWLPEALKRVEPVRWIHFLSAGVDAIWGMDFDKENKLLTKSSGVHGPTMAEYALGAMLHFFKSFDRYIEQSRERVWGRHWMDELGGKTVMVLGAGRIGAEIARRCRAFDMRVVGVRRRQVGDAGAYTLVTRSEAMGMLGDVDVLVVTLPLTDETRGLVDGRMLASLKRGAIIVDVSRGGVVDQMALLALVDEGHIRGAAIDVFESEPLPQSSPLWGKREILLTPHVSGTTPSYMERAVAIFIENLEALSAGLPATTPVDVRAGY